MAEDALDYVPPGNKADRVLGGLRALRNGRKASPLGPALSADHDKLRAVAEDLAERLLSQGLVEEHEVSEALGGAQPAPLRDSIAGPAAQRTPVVGGRSDPSLAPARVETAPDDAPIFVVHGHDDGLLHQVVRVLEKATSREVIVLHEQPNAGLTVLEKFEAHASTAAYAVVLLTPDDYGAAKAREARPRARQNVIFELGFFYGKLGRRHVAVLLAPEVEQPSDIAGLVYIPVDSGAWKYALARELQAAGIAVAMDRIP